MNWYSTLRRATPGSCEHTSWISSLPCLPPEFAPQAITKRHPCSPWSNRRWLRQPHRDGGLGNDAVLAVLTSNLEHITSCKKGWDSWRGVVLCGVRPQPHHAHHPLMHSGRPRWVRPCCPYAPTSPSRQMPRFSHSHHHKSHGPWRRGPPVCMQCRCHVSLERSPMLSLVS